MHAKNHSCTIIPNIELPAEKKKSIGIYRKRHLRYLKECKKITYTNLLISGKLNSYLADIDEQVRVRFEMLVERMKKAQGITEQLKAEKPMAWVGCVNNIRLQAMEIINDEIIYK